MNWPTLNGKISIDIVAVAIASCISIALTLVSLSMALSWTPIVHEIRIIFDVASESNVWTWANVVILASAAYAHLLAAYFRWRFARPYGLFWILTAALLAGLSLDDLASFHERLDGIGRAWGGGQGFTHFAWVIPGFVIAAGIVGIFAMVAYRLEGRSRALLISGIACLIGSAVGLEAVGASVFVRSGYTAPYIAVYHAEEMLEALGASLLLGAGLADLPAPYRRASFYMRDERTALSSEPSLG